MRIENIDKAKVLLKRLDIAERNLADLQSVTSNWRTIKVVILDEESHEVNISHNILHADAILLKMVSMMMDEISNLQLELKLL